MVARTIDELVVTLGLDPTQFNEGQRKALDQFKQTKDAAKKTASDMETDGKQAAQFYGHIKSEALSLIAVLVGARDIGKFVGDTVTNLSAVGRIATVMGMAAPDVLAVSMAVQRIGGDAQAAQQSMLGLSQALERYSRFGEGSLEFKRGLGLVGALPTDTPLQVLQKFATWSQGKRPQDVELIGQQIGLNQDLINEAIQGRGKLDADVAQSYKNGIPSDGDIKKITELQKAFYNLAQSVKFAGTELVVDVADPLTHLLNTVSHFIRDFPTATKIVLGLVAALVALKTVGLGVSAARVLGLGGGTAGAAEVAEGGAAVAGGAPIAAIVAGGFALGPGKSGLPRSTEWGIAIGSSLVSKAAGGRAGSTVGGDLGGLFGVQGGAVLPASPTAADATPAGRAAQVQAFLQQQGWSAEQARGIVAGMIAENNRLDPTAKNPNSTAYGLTQSTKSSGRQDDFKRLFGHDIHQSTFGEQLQFLQWELTHSQKSAGATIASDQDAAHAAADFLRLFERPGAGLLGDFRRADRALGTGSTVVNINEVIVNAGAATDAKGIARHIGRQLSSALAAQANSATN